MELAAGVAAAPLGVEAAVVVVDARIIITVAVEKKEESKSVSEM